MFGKNNPFGSVNDIVSSRSSSRSRISYERNPVEDTRKTIETTTKIVKAVIEAPEAGTKKTVKKIAEAIKEDAESRGPFSTTSREGEMVRELIMDIKGEKVVDKVLPVSGCIVYCDLGPAEHTGVYIGGNHIVELNGDGKIKEVSADDFLDNSVFRTGTKIYIACDKDGNVLYNSKIADRAKNMLDKSRDYNLVMDNCHQFTCGCIIGNFENANNFFLFVNHTIETEMNNGQSIRWIPWDRKY